MAEKQSEALKDFRKLIEKANRRIPSAKREKEKKDLLFWFVDNCPSAAGPELAKKFKDYGIASGNDFKQLKMKILDSLGLKKGTTYRYCQQGDEMESLIEDIKFIYTARKKQVIFFSKGEGMEMDSLFIRIRNSFAHGNYFKKNDFYYLWNETGTVNKKLGSFMVLKYEDLKSIYESLSN